MARVIVSFLPSIVAEVTVAILIGVVVAAAAGRRMVSLDPGLRFAAQRVLRLGIVLLGARLSLAEIARIGLPATAVIVVTMTASFVIVLLVARLVRIEGRLAVLIAVGSAVCGNTAIVATAPVIGAKAREVQHHPDIDIRWQRIRFGITTHDAGNRLTAKDFELARQIDAIAAGHGAEPV